ncbi:MAG: hypothetical protein ACLSBH_00020 [Coprobacillus cateniformis]
MKCVGEHSSTINNSREISLNENQVNILEEIQFTYIDKGMAENEIK